MNKNYESSKQIYIFLRDHLGMGGIETYVYSKVKKVKELGHTAIWIKKKNAICDSSFKDVMFDGITIVCDRDYRYNIISKTIESMNVQEDTVIRIISFDVYSFSCAERFKAEFNKCKVYSFYFVPNFVYSVLYPETEYKGKKREKVRSEIAPIMRKLHNSGNIRYFSKKHMDAMTSSYGYTIEDRNYYSVLVESAKDEFDEEKRREVYNRDYFNLLSVSRFDFPHKGFLIGLIKAYGELKQKYPELRFTIVGYGKDQDVVENAISKLTEDARKDVFLVGKVSSEELNDYYDDADLNVSVAGCCSKGARNGTLSIPARHFDYSCEVYGFLPASRGYVVSDDPGFPVIPYIEEAINMSEEEYVSRCRESFEAYRADRDLKTDIFEIINESVNPTLSKKELDYLFRIEVCRVIRCKFRALFRVFSKLSMKKTKSKNETN